MYVGTLWIPKEYITCDIGHGTSSTQPAITNHKIPFT